MKRRVVVQDLNSFRVPSDFRGRSKIVVQLWWLVQSTLFQCSPQVLYGFRRFLVRLFGGKIGVGVLIRPSVKITYPWKVSIGDHSWIGDDATLYSLGEIVIGSNTVISQRSYICGGDHDMNSPDFRIRGRDIRIGDQVWVAADCFISPGVSIGDRTVIGARSSVFGNLAEDMVCFGSPCKPKYKRGDISAKGRLN